MDPPTELFKLKLLDLRGQVLAEYPLEKHSLKDQVYRVKPFTPPNTFFYIQVSLLVRRDSLKSHSQDNNESD